MAAVGVVTEILQWRASAGDSVEHIRLFRSMAISIRSVVAICICDRLLGLRRPDGHIYDVYWRMIAGTAVHSHLRGAAGCSTLHSEAGCCCSRPRRRLGRGKMAAVGVLAVLVQWRARAGNSVDDIVVMVAAVARLLLARSRRNLAVRRGLWTVDKLVVLDGNRSSIEKRVHRVLVHGHRSDGFPLAHLLSLQRALLIELVLLRCRRAARARAHSEEVLCRQVVKQAGKHLAGQLAGDRRAGQPVEANGPQRVGRLARLVTGPQRL